MLSLISLKFDVCVHVCMHYVCVLQSYCPKHTAMRNTAMRNSPSKQNFYSPLHQGNNVLGTGAGGGVVENRPSQLVQLQEQFYNYASAEDLVEKFKLSPKLSALIFNYWKLKRKVRITEAQAVDHRSYKYHST